MSQGFARFVVAATLVFFAAFFLWPILQVLHGGFIDADGQLFLETERIDAEALETRFKEAVAKDEKVELHLRADRATRYEKVAETMSAARRAGLTKIGFITQPGD